MNKFADKAVTGSDKLDNALVFVGALAIAVILFLGV